MDWAAYFKSHGDFVLAKLSGSDDVYELARKVQCMADDQIMTIEGVLYRCANHGRSGESFPEWLSVTRERTLKYGSILTGVAKEAFEFVLKKEEREPVREETMASIQKLKTIAQSHMNKGQS